MRIVLSLIIIMLLTSCSYKSCTVKPTVQQKEQSVKTNDSKTEKSTDILGKINEQVTPGSQINCTF